MSQQISMFKNFCHCNVAVSDLCDSKSKNKIAVIFFLIPMAGQRKAFYRQRILDSSCARKEIVDIDILIPSRNGDRKIMQSLRITSRPPLRKKKWSQLSQF